MLSKQVISASTRYECARSELTQRISIRLQINVYYVGAISTFSAAYIAFGGDRPSVPLILIPGVILPILSVMFYFWYTHNEHVIGYLSAYCAALEDNSDKEGPKIAGWFNHSLPVTFGGRSYESMQAMTSKARRLSDWGMMIGFASAPLICLLKVIMSHGHERDFSAILMGLTAIITNLLCFNLSHLSNFRRDVLLKNNYRHWF